MAGGRLWNDSEVEKLRSEYAYKPVSKLEEEMERSKRAIEIKANDLGLSTNRTAQRRWNIVNSDSSPPELKDYELGFIIGLITGEGSFVVKNEGNGNKSFTLDMQLKNDSELLRRVRDCLGVGSVYESDSEYSQYHVGDVEVLWNVIVPLIDSGTFMNARKEEQYENWKSEMREYYDLEKRTE